MMAAQPVISEFLAKNTRTLQDGNGNYSDWIELQNAGNASVDLVGWHLSDDPTNPGKWTFPTSTPLAAGAFLVVFADGTGTTDPAGDLHTNFSLSTDGETLVLARPDLSTASEWNADGTPYPTQLPDVSYGTGTVYHNTTLVAPGAAARALVPHDGTLDAGQWTAINYNDSAWTAGTTGVGYDTGAYEDNSVPPTLTGDWAADDLSATVANGAKVSTWTDEVAGAKAVGSGSPLLVNNDVNGHAAVRFAPSDGNDQLRVAAASNPMSGAGDFTVVVVFKTSAAGTGAKGEWYSNDGLVDGEESGTTDDWGLAESSNGSLGAGLGNPDTTVYAASRVNTGTAHVAVYARTGASFTLYVDGGNGVSGAGSAADRDVEDMVFGSLQTNVNYFTGDLAEVRVYDGAATTAAKAYALAQPMGTKYNVSLSTPTTVAGPTLTGDWVGDSVAPLGNNATVSNWTSTANGATRNASAGSVATAPTVQTNQLNGHAVVHFAGPSSDQLRVASGVNPMSGAQNFTVAVVFRTSTPGVGTATNWYANTGIVDAEQGGTTNDWGLAINSSGQAAAGLGNPDVTTYGGLLDDGLPHVVVYTRTGGTTDLYVDGSATPFEDDDGGTAARNVADMVFGSIQTNGDYFTGDLGEVQVYNGALPSSSVNALSNTLATKYGVALAPTPYAALIGLNVQSAMSGSATTADVRVPFTVAGDPSLYTRLVLDMQYDDGFVAYLNGTEIARRNAPAGAITYTSVATAVHPKSQALVPEAIDVSAFISLLQGNGATNVLSIKALNTSLTDPDLLVVPQLVASTSAVGPAYFPAPTPGAANTTDGYVGFAQTPTISVPHGYYSATFATTLSDATPGATIYYTTDGSDPSPTNGTAIAPASPTALASGTVTISASTPLRAAAFEDAYLPSTVATTTYVFVASVLTQANTAPAGAYWSTAVNPAVVNLAQTYSVAQALTAIPSMSLTLPFADIFGPDGIYSNPTSKGAAYEREASAEYFDPNNPTDPGFQVNAGLRIQGGADRGGGDPKKSFRLFFRSEYGTSQLTYPIFGTANPQQGLDHLLLKAIHNYSWANAGGTDPTQGDLVRDQFARDLQQAMTGHSATTKWVQLYINGQYWGLYAATEEPDSTWAAANFGGSKDDYDVLQPDGSGGVEVVDGTGTAYQSLYTTIAADFADGSVSAAEYAALQPLVDMKGLVDYMLNVFYRGDQDAPVLIGSTTSPRNFYAFRDAATNGPFEFTTWDGELGLGDVNFNRTAVAGNLNPGTLFQDLKTDPDFAQLVSDEVYKFFYNGGVLESDATVDNPMTRYDADAAQINVAIVGESARWGTDQTSTPMTRDGDWVPEINNLNTNYFPQRSAIVLAQLKAISQFSMLGTLPPSFYVSGNANRGGTVTFGAPLTLVDANAATTGDVIYYTLDGSDPRLSGGAVSSTAHVYTGAVPLTATETVTVRILNGTTWSPIDAATYSVNAPASAANLAITEVDYHPLDPSAAELAVNSAWTGDDFEFIELVNTASGTIDLTGCTFDLGVTMTFGAVTLPAGGRVVVVSNPAAFAARYGNTATVAGTYTGHLSNSSATVDLKSAAGAVIANFTYQDSWYPRSDGDGSSLEAVTPINGSTAGNLPANWRASYEVNGTPGTAGTPVTDVVVNEVVSAAANGGPDAVELYNTTSAPINVGGWFLTDSSKNLTAYTIPANTVIAANGYLVISGTQFDNPSSPTAFGINGTSGDNLFLTKPKTAGGTTAYAFADSDTFGTSAIGESFGREFNGTGYILYPEASVTLGAANSGPRIGPVDITELMYNPTAGTTNLQYVEIQNQTNAAVDLSAWSFSQGITYTFPSGTTLAPYEAVTLVHFAMTDTTSLAAFRSAYALDASYRLLGPFTDKLSAKGEEVELVRPDAPRPDAPAYTPLLLVDDVAFGVASPWPVTAVGQALVRSSNHVFGETYANWAAAAPSPDTVTYGHAWVEGTAHVTLPSGTTLDSLSTAGTAVVMLAAGTGSWLRTAGLSLAAGTKLDVGTGALILDGVPAATASAAVATGFANGAWTGAGITSSAAAANVAHTTAVGVLPNATGIYASFDGQPVNASDVLVRYTYYGDANIDGKVTAADYTRVDAGYITHQTGWSNGDFNYDGVVDGSDYSLMDNAFNTQSAALFPAAVIAAPAIGAAPAAVVATVQRTTTPPAATSGTSTVRVASAPAAPTWWAAFEPTDHKRKGGSAAPF